MKRELSILIPTFNSVCTELVKTLCRQAAAIESLTFEVVVADDGSTDQATLSANRSIALLPRCRFIEVGTNRGRAAIRNFLAREARYPWLLFLDSHMSIVREDFVDRYLSNDGEVLYGGYVVGQGEPSNLRYRYEKACEARHRTEERRKRPYQHFHTGNFMVSREAFISHPLDERFHRYGYEDILWGKELKKAGIAITHIDNPAGFLTFEDNEHFVRKTEEALLTLNEFRDTLRGYSQMLTLSENIHLTVIRRAIRLWHCCFWKLERRQLCGSHPSLLVFKLYKIGFFFRHETICL
jgi:glycosyltransferase involved in cell wall biosynthesis